MSSSPIQQRYRFLVRLARIIGNLAHRAPLLILLDDVHLADASSWDCLHYFAHELSDTSILVVLAARPAELADQPGRAQLLLGLEQENLLLRLNVGPLDRQAIGELAETVLEEPPPRVLVEWLTLRSGGNPLFALGLLRALLDEGGDLAAPELRYLPEDLVERVASRLAALDERQRAIVELLAVVEPEKLGVTADDGQGPADLVDRVPLQGAHTERNGGSLPVGCRLHRAQGHGGGS